MKTELHIFEKEWKAYVIKIGKGTYYRYGGNTRDIKKATQFKSHEAMAMRNILGEYKKGELICVE